MYLPHQQFVSKNRSEKYNVKCHKKLKSKPSLELINFEMK